MKENKSSYSNIHKVNLDDYNISNVEFNIGKENIIMYTCYNENALGFYEKIGMTKPNDVVVLNEIEWTGFVVE
jgi:hypothetical protein